MRIGYLGDGPWAHKAFENIINDKSMEIAFVTVRYDKQDATLLQLARDNDIPIELSDNINSREFISTVKRYDIDLLVSMSFDQIFRTELINLPKYKAINCHAGKLPFYRGRNILNWVLINDEKEFGITVHYIDEGIDTGDIILQEVYMITDDDDYSTLLTRSYNGCADILYKALKMIQRNDVKSVKQYAIDPVGMYCGIRQMGDEIIDWNQSSRRIFNFIRALCKPGPQATSWIRGKKICINKARQVPGAYVYINKPGQVIGKTELGFLIKTQDTMLEIIEYTYDGKIRVGDRLEDHE
ncbi:MAG: methionyl-tRNA formyltransferase [Lachnospiraceae bacterium]|nr:methionyl-tRNA formyltransferase [Lachnospiraceae bacterium]